MAENNNINERKEIYEDSETDRESFSQSDDDVQDYMMLADRRLLMLEFDRKRKRAMDMNAKGLGRRTAKPWLRTQCSILKICRLRSVIKQPALRDAIEKMGFGSLLLIDKFRMPLKFLKKVITRFDPYQCAIYDHIGMKMDFGRMEIGSALGVPFTGTKIPENISKELSINLKKEFGLIGPRGEEVKVHLTAVFKRLTEFTTPSDEFKRWFIAYVLTCFLCPTTVDYLSSSNIPAISVAANAEKYNWAEYVLRWLRRFAQSFHGIMKERKVAPDGLGGCLAALLIIYLESVDGSYERGLPEFPEENAGTICYWTKEIMAARLKKELPIIMKAKKIPLYKDLDDEDDTIDKISIKEYIKESPGVKQKVRSYKRETSGKKKREIIKETKVHETNDKGNNSGYVDINECIVDRKPPGIVIQEGKKLEREPIKTDLKGKGRAEFLEDENKFLRKQLRRLEQQERMWKSGSSVHAPVEGGSSKDQNSGSAGSSSLTAVNDMSRLASSSTILEQSVDAYVKLGENDKMESAEYNNKEINDKDINNPANWIMVVYGQRVDETKSEDSPGLSKEDVAAVIEMFEAEDLEKEMLRRQQQVGLDDFMPSFDIGFSTPEPNKKEESVDTVREIITSGSKSSGTNQMKPPRKRMAPVKYQDHVLPQMNTRRSFRDQIKWDEVKKSYIGIKGRNKDDDIIEKVWMYVSPYKSGDDKWLPVFDYKYFPVKFNQNMLREELNGATHISASLIDLYAMRLMSKWKLKKAMRFLSPIYIMPTAFSKIVMDDFILGGITTAFDDVKKYFLTTSEDGSIIFKHAERVFVPVLSKISIDAPENGGVLHWWCVCVNFVQPHVDVLDSVTTSLDRDNEKCVKQLVSSVLNARALLKNKDYDASSFLRGGYNGISNASRKGNMHTSGIHLMKWFEDWDGVYESRRYETETDVDFKKWMVADMIIDGDNKHLYSIVPRIGFPISKQ